MFEYYLLPQPAYQTSKASNYPSTIAWLVLNPCSSLQIEYPIQQSHRQKLPLQDGMHDQGSWEFRSKILRNSMPGQVYKNINWWISMSTIFNFGFYLYSGKDLPNWMGGWQFCHCNVTSSFICNKRIFCSFLTVITSCKLSKVSVIIAFHFVVENFRFTSIWTWNKMFVQNL